MGCIGSKEPIDFDGPVDFKHFEILRAIGKGAFGKVCIVKKKDTKEMYALKYMNKIQIIEKRAMDNVFREISILKILEHPFIVNLWFAFQDEEDIFLVLDLMLGGDLNYHLEKEGRFSVNRVRLYMAELCLALEYLREKKIIHRDLKPANMLLDSKGHVHLTDFNVACILKQGKVATSMTGTKPYMAPEVIRPSSRGYSYAVDWWSLGVSVYEMLRGERPYNIVHGISNDEIYSMLTRVRPPASARWDEPTCNILKILLHPDSSKRLASLEAAKAHPFFNGINWDDVNKLETNPDYVPSQNRIHCDPTHELEEMIVEPNPLHKKRSRLSRRNGNSVQEDSKLAEQLNRVQTKFRPYDRIKESTAALEAIALEESAEHGLAESPSVSAARELPTKESSLSLPKAPLSRTPTEAADLHEKGGNIPLEIKVIVHDLDDSSLKNDIKIEEIESMSDETTPTSKSDMQPEDMTPPDTTEQGTDKTIPTGEAVATGNKQDTPSTDVIQTTPTNLESSAEEEALSTSRSSEKIAPVVQGDVDDNSWFVIENETNQRSLQEDSKDTAASEDTGTNTGPGIVSHQDIKIQTVDLVDVSRTEGVASC